VTEARTWNDSKKQAFVFFRVLIENKLANQEVKVWYRLAHASESDPSKVQTGSDLRQAEGPDWLASLKSRSTKIKANNELALAA